jgi:DNA adenine methylase
LWEKSLTLEAQTARPLPFLKWAGGKGKLLKDFEKFLPINFATYHEPFLGGGAVFFQLASRGRLKDAILSDSNRDLINSYVVVRDALDDLLSELARLQRHTTDKNFFYNIARKRFNLVKLATGLECNVKKAALLFYLNKTCYNGLYRVNKSNEFNVPWGRYKRPRIYDEENLRSVNEVLNRPNIRVLCSDYREAVKRTAPRDFIYCDPPYQPLSSTASFTSYTPGSFGAADQVRLADVYRELDAKGCFVMLSNSPRVLSVSKGLYKGFRIERLRATRAISSVGSKRGPVEEILVLNY